jgi:hypothetical protein
MPLLDFAAIAEQLPDSWRSTQLGRVEAGIAHALLGGRHGTRVIIDV